VRGRLSEARDLALGHLARARELGYRQGETYAAGALADFSLLLGQVEEARAYHQRHLALCREVGYRQGEGSALGFAGLLAERDGDLEGAARLLAEALAFQRGIGHRPGVASTLVALGRVELARDRGDAAAVALEEARALGDELKSADVILPSAAHRARLPGGDPAAAEALLAEHEHRAALGVRMETRYALWQATRDPAHLAEADRLLGELIEHAPEECRRTMVDEVPRHRAIAAAAGRS